MKRKLALILALLLIACAALPTLAAGRQGGYNPSGAHGEDMKAEFTVQVHDPALEINVWGRLWFNAADEYYIANHEQDMFTVSVAIPEGIDLSRCYIQSAYNGWLPVFFSELIYENGCYTYTGPIDSIYTTGYNFSDIQIYVDQEYNPFGHWPDMIINVYATPDDVDSFCSEFDGAGWEYIDEPAHSTPTPSEPTPTPEAPTPTPELPTTPEPGDPTPEPGDPTPEPGDPTPEPGEPTPAPADPDDPPKAGGASLIVLGIAAIASVAGMAGAAVLKKRR